MPLAAGEISSKNAPVSAGMRGVPRLKGPAARAREGQLPMLPAPAVAAANASRNSLRAVKKEPAMAVSAERIAETSKKYLYKKEKLSTGTCYVSTVDSFPGW